MKEEICFCGHPKCRHTLIKREREKIFRSATNEDTMTTDIPLWVGNLIFRHKKITLPELRGECKHCVCSEYSLKLTNNT